MITERSISQVKPIPIVNSTMNKNNSTNITPFPENLNVILCDLPIQPQSTSAINNTLSKAVAKKLSIIENESDVWIETDYLLFFNALSHYGLKSAEAHLEAV